MKFTKMNHLTWSVVMTVIGLVLTVAPQTALNLVCYGIATVLAVLGIVNIVGYLTSRTQDNQTSLLVKGIVLLVLSGVITSLIGMILSMILSFLGFFVAVSGVQKFWNSILMKRANESSWAVIMVLAVVSVVLGMMLLFKPGKVTRFAIRIAGICVLYSGITDLISRYYVDKKTRAYREDMEALEQDGIWK